MMPDIQSLAEHPEFHDIVSEWLWQEWGTPLNRGLYHSLVVHCQKDTIPMMFVACVHKKPVGTVGLLRTDLLSRQEFTPWMAVLYVLPEYRGMGIASNLQEHALKEVKQLKVPHLFLYTKLSGFYEKTGWKYLESDVDDKGDSIRIYQKIL